MTDKTNGTLVCAVKHLIMHEINPLNQCAQCDSAQMLARVAYACMYASHGHAGRTF